MSETKVEDYKEITKQIVEQFLALTEQNGANKFDIEEMYRASNNLGYKQIHVFIGRCVLLAELGIYHDLIQRIEHYKSKYRIGERND